MEKRKLRVYVAGAYNADNVVGVLRNMRKGIDLSIQVLKAGMAPFCPWLDFQFGLKEDFDRETYLDYSMAWLEASDAVLVQTVGVGESGGTRAELWRAEELGIPIFTNIESLLEWAEERDG